MRIIHAQTIMQDAPAHARLPHSAQYAMGSAFISGEYKGLHEASIPIVDMGFLQGDVAYEVVTVSKGAFFRLQDHLQNMERSCEQLYLRNPYNRDQTESILSKLVSLTGTKDAYVWWGVTRGLWLGGERSDLDAFDNCLYAFVMPYQFGFNDEQCDRGLDVITTHPAVYMTGGGGWGDLTRALVKARREQKDWVVLIDSDGFLVESPGVDIFLVKGGELYANSSRSPRGTMYQSVIELAEELGVNSQVARLNRALLMSADEAFFATCDGSIAPINSIDARLLGGAESIGTLTRQFHDRYWQKRWSGWHATPVDYMSRARPRCQ